jgi:hypothetical protein
MSLHSPSPRAHRSREPRARSRGSRRSRRRVLRPRRCSSSRDDEDRMPPRRSRPPCPRVLDDAFPLGRGDRHGRLVGHDLDHRLVLLDDVARLHEPATISPSVTPSPMSGSLNSQRAMIVSPRVTLASELRGLDDRRQDAVRERQVFHLERVGERRVEAGDAPGAPRGGGTPSR